MSSNRLKKGARCCNIDWLQVYLEEDLTYYPMNAEFFERAGWSVKVRDYATPIYNEVFELRDKQGHPLFEICRSPRQTNSKNKVDLPYYACHLRLANRTCYYDNPVILLRDFLITYRYTFCSITRIDLCLDFIKFDSGIDPKDFIRRYMAHTYAKINQGRLNSFAADEWHGRVWESLSWGSPSSVVKTKIYNKTKELEDEGDKPYIRQAWLQCGLIDNFKDNTKMKKDGTIYKPTIWRLEFSIKAGGTKVFKMVDESGRKKIDRIMEHHLQTYDGRERCFYMFACLTQCYFRFKKYQPNVRKDRCEDVSLFRFDDIGALQYKIGRPLSERRTGLNLTRLKCQLMKLADETYSEDDRLQVYAVISVLEQIQLRDLADNQFDKSYIYALQHILHDASRGKKIDFCNDLRKYQLDYEQERQNSQSTAVK